MKVARTLNGSFLTACILRDFGSIVSRKGCASAREFTPPAVGTAPAAIEPVVDRFLAGKKGSNGTVVMLR